MATADEILAGAVEVASEEVTEDKVLRIDNELRTIAIPSTVKLLGVESDENVNRLEFEMPRHYGEFDLSTFSVRVNHMNANGDGDIYKVTDLVAYEEKMTFSWLVGRTAFMYKGDVQFVVCLKRISENFVVEQEFNTTIASLPVLEGLEPSEQLMQEYPDIIEQILKYMETPVSSEEIGKAVEEYLKENPVGWATINDEEVSAGSVWSSQKTSLQISEKIAEHNTDQTTHADIRNLIAAKSPIDDTVAVEDKLWSSKKTSTELSTLSQQSADKYMLKTGTAADSAKLGGKPPEYYKQALNLLPNSDFRRPISQRGLTSLTGTGYMIDCWRGHFTQNTFAVIDDGIRVTSISSAAGWHWRAALQNGAEYVGKSMTAFAEIVEVADMGRAYLYLSCRDSNDAQIEYASTALEVGVLTCSVTVPQNTVYIRVGIYSSALTAEKERSFVIASCELYEGEYTLETRPQREKKDEVTKLLECQRRLMVYQTLGGNDTLVAAGYCASETEARLVVDLPTPMEIDAPTVTLKKVEAYVCVGGGRYAATGISATGCKRNQLHMRATLSEISGSKTNKACALMLKAVVDKDESAEDCMMIVSAEI